MIVALTAVIGNFNNEDKMIVVASGIVLKALSSIWDGDKKDLVGCNYNKYSPWYMVPVVYILFHQVEQCNKVRTMYWCLRYVNLCV
jgi:hypothetical protein